jgi:hypothetical protein
MEENPKTLPIGVEAAEMPAARARASAQARVDARGNLPEAYRRLCELVDRGGLTYQRMADQMRDEGLRTPKGLVIDKPWVSVSLAYLRKRGFVAPTGKAKPGPKPFLAQIPGEIIASDDLLRQVLESDLLPRVKVEVLKRLMK